MQVKWPLYHSDHSDKRKGRVVRGEATTFQLQHMIRSMKVATRMFSFLSNSIRVDCSINTPKTIGRFVLVTKVFLTLEQSVSAPDYRQDFYAHHFPRFLLLPIFSISFQYSDWLVLYSPTKLLSALSTGPAWLQFWIFRYVIPVFETLLSSLPHITHFSFRPQNNHLL